MRLLELEALYSTAEYRIDYRKVQADDFHAFCTALRRCEMAVGEHQADEMWKAVLRPLRRARFDLSASISSFRSILSGLEIDHCTKYSERILRLYPEFSAPFGAVAKSYALLRESIENPWIDPIKAILEDLGGTRSATIVAVEPRLVRGMEISLALFGAKTRVVSASQLRYSETFSCLVTIGSALWYPDHVFHSARAPVILNVAYEWNLRAPRLHSFDPRAVTVVQPDAPPPPVITVQSSLHEPLIDDALAEAMIFVQKTAPTEADADEVASIPVSLDNGFVVFADASEGASVLVIEIQPQRKAQVRRKHLALLQPGDFLLVRDGGGGDYVVPVADRLLGERAESCRGIQREWKWRLALHADRYGLPTLCEELAKLGAVRASESNVRRWLSPRSIRPADYADFAALMRVAGLEDSAQKIWKQMELIDRAHMRAGQIIRRELLTQVAKADLEQLERYGEMVFELPGKHAGNLIACRVKGIGNEQVRISASRLGAIFDPTAGKWHG